MKTQRLYHQSLTLLFVLTALFCSQPAQAAPHLLTIKRPDLVLKKNGTSVVHVVTIYNQGTLPAGPFIISVERFNGSVTNYWVSGLAVGETMYVGTFFRQTAEEELTITADGANQVIELNEENNQLWWGVGERVDA